MDIIVSPLSDKDVGDVYGIEKQCFSLPWSKDAIEKGIGSWLVAHIDGEVAGYLGFFVVENECNITNLAVKNEHRRKGIAKTLLYALDYPVVFLEVRASNAAAIALYEKCGFIRIGVRKNFYSHPTEDAILMKKEK